jgi:hypothetical protein
VPPVARPGTCHLVFIGDSFVEAHQVEIEQKVQVVACQLSVCRSKEIGDLRLRSSIAATGSECNVFKLSRTCYTKRSASSGNRSHVS